ncbi:uncharacterized protein CDAR_127091 [Caerostris darwini]|uniref:MATH domain-containing protein n=1 Tax=Caerostris darwini TaxID=1538125 RepID=A0AAV4XBN1_9ARAC|nr:uncharacterized protein CDAR_127091 [Caerostris darwini]
MSELHSRKFADENGEFLMDLTMSNALTVYEVDLRMSHLPFGSHQKLSNAETPYFAFGGFEWNVAIHPQGGFDFIAIHIFVPHWNEKLGEKIRNFKVYAVDKSADWKVLLFIVRKRVLQLSLLVCGCSKLWWCSLGLPEDQETSNRPKILLNRLTGFDHAVRVQYRVVLGDAERVFDSGIQCQMSDMTGKIRGFPLKCGVSDLLHRGLLRIYVEMMFANAISEVLIPLQNRDPSDTTPNCYDREKHAWLAEGDIEGECLKLKLFCSDLHHVPRNHLRYVSWNAYVVRNETNMIVLNAPHWNYYIQEGVDMGIVMETDIPVSVVDDLSNNCKEPKSVTIEIEWLDSLLLFSAIYHKYDDIRRLHCHQMKREIVALQEENYSLERQLFSYQKSISIVNSRGQPPEGADGVYEHRAQGESFPDVKYM